MSNRNRNDRGFTLVEIMVVVVIIGLLVAFAGPRIWSMLGFGQVSIAEAKCQEYYNNAKTWHMVKKKYPETLEDMQQPLTKGDADDFIRVEEDPWGNKYVLEREGKRLRVFSWGPDGLEGTEDDIVYPKEEE